MKTIYIQYYKSPLGEMILGSFEGKLCLADWRYRKMRDVIDKRIQDGLGAEYREDESSVIEQTKLQLNEYFDGKCEIFDVELELLGTEFQKRVWQELQTIPFGQTESYLGLSRRLGDEKAIRAVANANGANAISIIVPCHRIIGSKGELIGYAGGLPVKKKLLQLENRGLNPKQLELF